MSVQSFYHQSITSTINATWPYTIQYNTKFVKRHFAVASEALYPAARRSAANPRHAAAAVNDRQTDGRTDGRTPDCSINPPCSAYYAGGVSELRGMCLSYIKANGKETTCCAQDLTQEHLRTNPVTQYSTTHHRQPSPNSPPFRGL